MSFRHRQNEKDTKLPKYVWELKAKHMEYQIRWSVVQKSSGYNPVTKLRYLLLLEKLLPFNTSNTSRLMSD